MHDILGRTIESGMFVMFARKYGSNYTLSVGVVLQAYGVHRRKDDDILEKIEVVGTSLNMHTKTWQVGVKRFTTKANNAYIITDLPDKLKESLHYAYKAFMPALREDVSKV